MEATLGDLRGQLALTEEGQVAFNEATQRYVDASGNFVSSAEGQERVLEELRSMGIRTEEGLQEQVGTLQRLKDAVEEGGVAYEQLADKQQRLQTELSESGQSAAQQARSLERLDQQLGESTVAMGNFAARQQQLRSQFGGLSASTSATADEMQALFPIASDLGFVLQDAGSFALSTTQGIRAVSNNIPSMVRGFRTAKASGASLLSIFSGPAGLLIGVNALAGALPFLTQQLSSMGEEAEDTADETENLASQIFRLRKESEDPIRLGLEQARRQVNLLSTRLEELRDLRSDVQELNQPQTPRPTAGGALQPSGIALPQEGAAATTPAQAEDLERLREQIELSEKARQRLNDIIAERELQNELLKQERRQIASSTNLTKTQVQQIQEGTASTEALVTASEEGVVRFRRLSGLADDLLGRYQSVNQLLEGQNRLVDENLVTQEQVTDELASRLEDAENIEQVQQRLNSAVEDGLITREQMQAVMEDIRSDTEETTDEAEKLAEAQRRITSAVEQELLAREEAKALVEDLGTSNDQVARSTAEALGNVEDLRAQLTDLAGPQGKALAQARRTKEQYQRQVEALQNVNRILARREAGIQAEQVMPTGPGSLGEMPPVLQSIQELSGQPNVLKQYAQQLEAAKIQAQGLAEAVQDVELAGSGLEMGRTQDQGTTVAPPGLSALGTSVEELQRQFDVGEKEAQRFKKTAQRQLGQVLSTAARIGTTLEQSFEGGEFSARKFAKTVLPLLGQIIGTIAGGPAGGAIGGAAGQIAALPFAEGGEVRGPGGPTDDQIPAWLSHREFVMQAEAAKQAPAALRAMNDNPALAEMVEQMFVGQFPEEFASGGFATASDGAASSTMQAEQELQAAPPKRELSVQLETEVKRLNRRELGLLVRGADGIRDQYEYNS